MGNGIGTATGVVLLLAAAAFGQDNTKTWKDRHGRTWTTTERLLLDAATAKQALNGDVWVNNGGSHVAYIRQQGKQRCFVVDGVAGPLGVSARPLDLLRSEVFFGNGEHYAYITSQKGRGYWVVVDGKPGTEYRFIDYTKRAYLSPTRKTWSYVGDLHEKGVFVIVVNGKETAKASFVARSILLTEGHSLFIDYRDDKYYAIFDGKPGKGWGYVEEQSLTLSPAGAYAYAAKDDMNKKGYFVVVNGKPSARYAYVGARLDIRFSRDGKHYAFSAIKTLSKEKGKGEYVVVVDGKELAIPDAAHSLALSPDGRHWACALGETAVMLDGGVVRSGYESIGAGSLRFSLDGSRLAYAARRGGKGFVVVDGKEQPAHERAWGVVFSPDGRRFAYAASRAKVGQEFVVVDGKEEKVYDKISTRTINFGLDGKAISYVVRVGKFKNRILADGEKGFLVVEGKQRPLFDKLLARPNKTLYIGAGSLSCVGVRDGAYYWVEERRAPK